MGGGNFVNLALLSGDLQGHLGKPHSLSSQVATHVDSMGLWERVLDSEFKSCPVPYLCDPGQTTSSL